MPRTAALTVALTLVSGALTAGALTTGAPASATGASERRAEARPPTWTSLVQGQDPYDSHVWNAGAVIDPVSGDAFTAVYNDDDDAPKQLRRLDVDTGTEEWQLGVGPDTETDLDLAIDPEGQRLVLAANEPGAVAVHSVDLDGQLQWTQTLSRPGTLQDVVVNQQTGTACVTTVLPAKGSRVRTAWRLDCLDRNGAVVMTKVFRHSRPISGDLALAVDSQRKRWYVAGSHLTAKGTRTVVLAFREGGGKVWKRTRDRRGTTKDTAPKITVDTGSHRVLVAGHHSGKGTGNQVTLAGWTFAGRLKVDRSWRADGRHQAVDITADPKSHRVLVAQTGIYSGSILVRVMKAGGKRIQTIKHSTIGDIDTTSVAVDWKRRLVLVSGRTTAAYSWQGKRQWVSDYEDYRPEGTAYDQQRGRLVVPWRDNSDFASPDAYVSSWPVE
jgi:hypothetical protein